MSKRILYILIGSIALVIVLVGVGIFVFISTAQSANANKVATPTSGTPVHKGNGVAKIMRQNAPAIKNQIAQGLHLTPDQLTAQLAAGKTLSDVATAQKVSSTQLQTIIGSALQNSLQSATSDGSITQQQLNRLVKRYQANPALLDHLLGGKALTPTPTVKATPAQ